MATDNQISVRISSEMLERAQLLADKAGITRHKLLANLVEAGIESLEEMDKIGILRAAILSRNFGESVKRALRPTGPEAVELKKAS